MRAIRRAAITVGVLMTALLPVTAAVSPQAAFAADVPVAIAQPVGDLARLLATSSVTPVVPEAGLILLVGSGLLGLAAIVRKSTRM